MKFLEVLLALFLNSIAFAQVPQGPPMIHDDYSKMTKDELKFQVQSDWQQYEIEIRQHLTSSKEIDDDGLMDKWRVAHQQEQEEWKKDAVLVEFHPDSAHWEAQAKAAVDEPFFQLWARKEFRVPFEGYFVKDLGEGKKSISPAHYNPKSQQWERWGVQLFYTGRHRFTSMLAFPIPTDIIFDGDEIKIPRVEATASNCQGFCNVEASLVFDRKTLRSKEFKYFDDSKGNRALKLDFDFLELGWSHEVYQDSETDYVDATLESYADDIFGRAQLTTIDNRDWIFYAEGVAKQTWAPQAKGYFFYPNKGFVRYWGQGQENSVRVYVKLEPWTLDGKKMKVTLLEDLIVCKDDDCFTYPKNTPVLLSTLLSEKRGIPPFSFLRKWKRTHAEVSP